MERRIGLIGAVLLLAACGSKEKAGQAAAGDTIVAPSGPATRVSATTGFSTPESVRWDAEQGVWFVSNIDGSPTAKDGNGFISRLRSDGAVDSLRFVAGGRDGVTLNAPKGMVIVGDTLWVADIDAVRGFDRHTGAPVANVAVRALFLNDIAAGPDGTLYVTDTGIRFDAQGQPNHPGPDRIVAIRGRTASVAVEGDWLQWPNGITWDPSAARFIVVPFGGKTVMGWAPGQTRGDSLGAGPGGEDGVEILPDGRVLITSWADSSVFALQNGSTTRVVSGVNSPADIGYDPARNLLAIPIFTENRVEFWTVTPRS